MKFKKYKAFCELVELAKKVNEAVITLEKSDNLSYTEELKEDIIFWNEKINPNKHISFDCHSCLGYTIITRMDYADSNKFFGLPAPFYFLRLDIINFLHKHIEDNVCEGASGEL